MTCPLLSVSAGPRVGTSAFMVADQRGSPSLSGFLVVLVCGPQARSLLYEGDHALSAAAQVRIAPGCGTCGRGARPEPLCCIARPIPPAVERAGRNAVPAPKADDLDARLDVLF